MKKYIIPTATVFALNGNTLLAGSDLIIDADKETGTAYSKRRRGTSFQDDWDNEWEEENGDQPVF